MSQRITVGDTIYTTRGRGIVTAVTDRTAYVLFAGSDYPIPVPIEVVVKHDA